MSQLSIQIVRDRAALSSLAARWDELARLEPRDGFFRSFIWYSAWLEHIRPDAEPFVVVARDSSGTIVGLAPLCLLAYRDLGFRLKALAWGGREVVSGDFLDFLTVTENRVEVIQAMLAHLWERERAWGVLVIGELTCGAGSFRAVEQFGEESRGVVRRQEERLCPYIELPSSFDEYLATLGTSTRYHIRRRLREVEKKGGTVNTFTDPQTIVEKLDTLVQLHLARWRRDHLPGTFGRPGFVAFLQQVFLNPPAGTSWHLYELDYEGRSVASLLTFYFGVSALYYQAGWDPASPLAALSPGVVLMAHSVRDAVQHGLQYYEFLRGDEAYKSRWTKTHRSTTTLLLARSPMARGYLHTARLKDAIKQHAFWRNKERAKKGIAAA